MLLKCANRSSVSAVRISEFLCANVSSPCVRCTHLLKSLCDRCDHFVATTTSTVKSSHFHESYFLTWIHKHLIPCAPFERMGPHLAMHWFCRCFQATLTATTWLRIICQTQWLPCSSGSCPGPGIPGPACGQSFMGSQHQVTICV